MSLFDMSGKVAVITGSTRGIGRAIAERMAEHGAKVVVSSRKQDVCDQVTKEINDKFGKGTAVAIAANISSKENLQHLVDESNRAFGKIDVLVCNAASNPVLRAARRHFRRPVPQDPRQQHRRQQLADQHGGAADDRAQGRLDHHRVLDRRPEGLDRARRLRDFEGRRHAARAQPRLRIRQAQYPRELHRARPDQDRFCQGAVGQSGNAEGLHRALAAVAHRHARRDRGRRGAYGIGGRRLHDRPDHRDRRRRDDQLRVAARVISAKRDP